jgi:endonuclease-3 related protein
MSEIKHLFKILHKTFGNQNWWPTTLEGELHPSYHGKRIDDRQRFEIIVGAILTQNTSWKNVEKAIFNLNKEKALTTEKLKNISQKHLAQLIRPSGYYNQKAERLKIVADYFSNKKIDELKQTKQRKDIEELREELLSVKGIGPETADSILLYAFNKPIFVIDAYTKRIFSRIGLCKDRCRYEELQQLFHNSLKPNPKLFNEYHALIVELAKQHCMKKPDCNKCPISKFCKKLI